MALEIKFRSMNYIAVVTICKSFELTTAGLVVVFKTRAIYVLKVNKTFWFLLVLVVNLHSTQQDCGYLLKMGRMDEEKAIFERTANFKWLQEVGSTALKIFKNYTLIMSNSSNNIRISSVWRYCLCCFFWANSTSCYGEFFVVLKHLKNLILNILKKKMIIR